MFSCTIDPKHEAVIQLEQSMNIPMYVNQHNKHLEAVVH